MHTTPAMPPIAIAEPGGAKPQAGVIATSPATAPEIAPSTVGFPRSSHSASGQAIAAAAVAKWVLAKASVDRPPADNALPALKPNQPTHSSDAPMKLRTIECGGIASPG